MKRLTREDAVRVLCELSLGRMDVEARREQLEVMQGENWRTHPQGDTLSTYARDVLSREEILADPTDERFEPALMIWLESTMNGATNAYLLKLVRELDASVNAVEGVEPELTPCPCCGLRTLSDWGEYEICPVCWWEDAGHDNDFAADKISGPNHITLIEGRRNYLLTGICDPQHHDPRALQEPAEKYAVGRIFTLSDDNTRVIEAASGWSSA